MFNPFRREFPTGLVPDLERDNDPRNLLYEDIAPMSGADIPDEGDVEKGSWTLDQALTNSCTCHSTVHDINQVLGKQLSPRYVYHRIKTDPKYPSSQLEHGAYMVDSVKVMCDEGIPDYAICPNNSNDSDQAYINFTPTVSLEESAKANKGGAYVYVTSGRDHSVKCAQIVRYMYEQQRPVKVGITWRGSFNAARKNGIVPVEEPTGGIAGHDMLAVAWKKIGRDEYIGFRNSWGPRWGDKGRIWIPRKYLKISAGIAYYSKEKIVVPPKPEVRDVYLEKFKASELRKALYEKFPLNVSAGSAAANTMARAYAGRTWLVLVQAVSYKGWTITDVINALYAISRNKTESKAFSFDFNQVKV